MLKSDNPFADLADNYFQEHSKAYTAWEAEENPFRKLILKRKLDMVRVRFSLQHQSLVSSLLHEV